MCGEAAGRGRRSRAGIAAMRRLMRAPVALDLVRPSHRAAPRRPAPPQHLVESVGADAVAAASTAGADARGSALRSLASGATTSGASQACCAGVRSGVVEGPGMVAAQRRARSTSRMRSVRPRLAQPPGDQAVGQAAADQQHVNHGQAPPRWHGSRPHAILGAARPGKPVRGLAHAVVGKRARERAPQRMAPARRSATRSATPSAFAAAAHCRIWSCACGTMICGFPAPHAP